MRRFWKSNPCLYGGKIKVKIELPDFPAAFGCAPPVKMWLEAIGFCCRDTATQMRRRQRMRDRCYMLKTLVGIGLIILLGFCGTERVSADTGSEIIPLTLLEGKENSTYNLDSINKLCALASEETQLVLQIEVPGTYYVGADKGGRAIQLRSNVTLDLNGSTLIRAGLMNNFIQCSGLDGAQTAGGYTLCHDITVKNGTIDGSGGAKRDVNLINIGHAENVIFEQLTLKNCRSGHLIELCGCKDVVISDCTFDGFTGDQREGEAIQLDISYNGASESWNGVYTPDGTACRNITVDNCTFLNYPSGVGNHHALYDGNHSQNIRITNNKFLNKSSAAAPAIWCFGFDGCVIENNTITGKYTHGILVSGGSDVVVKGNVIGAEGKPLSGQGINCTVANSYLVDKGSSYKEQPLSGGVITENRISVTGSGKYGILVSSGSVLTEISSNEVISKQSDGIRLTGEGSWVRNIGASKAATGNTIVAHEGIGIAFGEGAGAKQIVGNSILSKKGGIQVASNSSVDVIGTKKYPNVIKNDAVGDGVVVTNGRVKSVAYNQITTLRDGILANKEAQIEDVHHNVIFVGCRYGIFVAQSATVKKIRENTIKDYLQKGIIISSSASVKNITKNTISGGTGAGIYITDSGAVDCTQKNQISKCKTEDGHGIHVTSTGIAAEIKGNVIKESEGYGIFITNTKINVKQNNNELLNNKMGKLYVKKG